MLRFITDILSGFKSFYSILMDYLSGLFLRGLLTEMMYTFPSLHAYYMPRQSHPRLDYCNNIW
jgi:hypothetical protein